ncbi:hypothetical protein [Corynebacterium spheniscorum]|uniref:hypothetical protein n=1 Tax=Corynebacterium spheniscorum TaxID=185761 RepID=UPI0015A5917A|nr:hypothetical protein [Corynebacterium spheniscorum]
MSEKSSRKAVHPNAITVAIMGAFLSVFIAGRNQSVIAGEIFLALALIGAFAVNHFRQD